MTENADLIADALESLWHRAPGRRSEIEAEMRRRDLWHDHDTDEDCPPGCPAGLVPLAGDMVPRAQLRWFLAREAEEAEASR